MPRRFVNLSPEHLALRLAHSRNLIDKPLVIKYAANELKAELDTKIDEFSNSREIYKELDELSERFRELDAIGQANRESSEA